MNNKLLITISHYNKRCKDNLIKLSNSLKNQNCDIFIVINDDNYSKEKKDVFNNIKTLIRPNTGMNLGAWNASFLNNRCYDFYIFLQDECQIMDITFLKKYIYELSKKNVGMTGESINYKWANDWSIISNSGLNYKVGYDLHKKPIYRVQYYLSLLKRWNIEAGKTGFHLRSLVWAFKREILERIVPFPIGSNKEECIAAEIAISKKIEQIKLMVTQINIKPFKYISHFEWKSDGSSKK